MATPMTSAQIVAQLVKWKVPFQFEFGWATRNRNDMGAWGPVNACVQHHTGDDAPDSNDIRYLITGDPNRGRGPYCQFATDDAGTVHLVGWGRALSAGGGDPATFAAVVAESYGDYPPAPHEHTGSAGSIDLNPRTYNNEATYSGGHPMTTAQYRSCVLLWAAVCDFHGWSAKSVIGHKETSDWKSDPGSLDMKVLRADVAAALTHGPEVAVVLPPKVDPPFPVPVPVPTPAHGGTFVSLTPLQEARIYLGIVFIVNVWRPKVDAMLGAIASGDKATADTILAELAKLTPAEPPPAA